MSSHRAYEKIMCTQMWLNVEFEMVSLYESDKVLDKIGMTWSGKIKKIGHDRIKIWYQQRYTIDCKSSSPLKAKDKLKLQRQTTRNSKEEGQSKYHCQGTQNGEQKGNSKINFLKEMGDHKN